MSCKTALDDIGVLHTVFEAEPLGSPQLIKPDGLSDARKKYLFEKIRQYCKEECKDLLCPEVYTVTSEEQEEPGTEERMLDSPPCASTSTRGKRECKRKRRN